MVYVLNTNLNPQKKLGRALTDIYGLGKQNASQICDLLGISVEKRVKQISGLQLEQLTQLVNQNYNISTEVKRSTLKNIHRLIKIASYRGFRHTEGLPVRGQRTHGNCRTRRKFKLDFSRY